jgi:Ni,Fe-hydrogenase I small subunit
MAITRRQFVTRLGVLATALGISQMDLAKVTEAFAHEAPWGSTWYDKPQVVWVHGAECTGDSTSLLSLFEDATGNIQGTPYSTLNALDLAVGGNGSGATVLSPSTNHPFGHRTMQNTAALTGMNPDGIANSSAVTVNIADVLLDFIALEYHETVMGMGGDLAYQYLTDAANNEHVKPFVLVVEGSLQKKTNPGYWNANASGLSTSTDASWCAIGADGTTSNNGTAAFEADMPETVAALASKSSCVLAIAIGQCAAFGGYPACISPVLSEGNTVDASMTGAQGLYDFLADNAPGMEAKVVNVPGCPTNPWWFILTVVAWMVDLAAVLASGNTAPGPLGILQSNLSLNPAAIDNTQRLKLVYGSSIHGPLCPRYQDFNNGVFAQVPGDKGCLQYLGCKGPGTLSLCAVHGWNGTNPNNAAAWEHNLGSIAGENGNRASFCISAGHPCMACTEKGYPDRFVPFVNR